MAYASVVGGSTLTAGYLALERPNIGPIYEFEMEDKNTLPLDYNLERMQNYFDNR